MPFLFFIIDIVVTAYAITTVLGILPKPKIIFAIETLKCVKDTLVLIKKGDSFMKSIAQKHRNKGGHSPVVLRIKKYQAHVFNYQIKPCPLKRANPKLFRLRQSSASSTMLLRKSRA